MDDKVAEGVAELVSQLERADSILEDRQRGDALRGVVRGALGTAREILEEARASADEAPVLTLDEQTLPEAIEALLAQYADRQEWSVELTVEGEPERLTPELRSGLVGVTREGLATIAEFTDADEVAVSVTVQSEGVELVVSDCGTGFDPASPEQANAGFADIREQARSIGGEFSLESSWTEGTAIVVKANNVIGD